MWLIFYSGFRPRARSHSATPTRRFAEPSPTLTLRTILRLSPTLTINLGLRWEFESPFTESLGRLVNLDIAPGFTAIAPVVATTPVGTVTGQRYPTSLIRPDLRGIQPRVGVAWRPVPGSSLLIRAGYGVYRNSSVYQAMDLLLAQQPPLSTAFTVQNSAENPLTLANGFPVPTFTANTFAVNPDLRVGYSHNWQLMAQRDLPASLTVTGTYLGTEAATCSGNSCRTRIRSARPIRVRPARRVLST